MISLEKLKNSLNFSVLDTGLTFASSSLSSNSSPLFFSFKIKNTKIDIMNCIAAPMIITYSQSN